MIEIGKFLYHMTHYNNLHGILKHGILSNTLVKQRGITTIDISDHGVQLRRHAKIETVYGRRIHDYTPFYLTPKNPMLYARSEIQDKIVIICVKMDILDKSEYVFADGNAASSDTKFWTNPNVFNTSNDVLKAHYWNEYPDGKRRRCAEVLVYPMVNILHIQRIVCKNEDIRRHITQLTDIETIVDTSFYF
jgi:hypothetical protein